MGAGERPEGAELGGKRPRSLDTVAVGHEWSGALRGIGEMVGGQVRR